MYTAPAAEHDYERDDFSLVTLFRFFLKKRKSKITKIITVDAMVHDLSNM